MLEHPAVLSVVGIIITIGLSCCGMVATVLMTIISFALKTTLNSINSKLLSFGERLDKTDEKIESINDKLHHRISGTDTEVTKITREFGEGIVRIEGMIDSLKKEFKTNLILDTKSTKK